MSSPIHVFEKPFVHNGIVLDSHFKAAAHHLKGVPMRNLFAIFLFLTFFVGNATAQTQLSNCISFSNTSARIIDRNSVYSAVSWRSQVTNSCPEPIIYDFTLKAQSADRIELDRSRQYDFYIPPLTSSIVSSRLLLTSSKAEGFNSVAITLDRASKAGSSIIGDSDSCLSVHSVKPSRVFTENTVYQRRSWQARVSNSCNRNFLVDLTYKVYDSESYEISSNSKYDAYIPSNGTVVVSYSDLLSPVNLFGSRGRDTVVIRRAQATDKKPLRQTHFAWLSSALSYFSDVDGKLLTSVKANGIGMFRLSLSMEPHPSDILFKLNEDSLVELDAETRGISTFNTATNYLTVPVAEVTLGQQKLILEDLSFNLIAAEGWFFRLEGYTEYSAPPRLLEGADDCIYVTLLDSKTLETNSVYSEVSFLADISNKCSREFLLDVEFTAHDSGGFVIDDTREYDFKVLPNASSTVTKRMLISPFILERGLAKIGVSVTVSK
jgi:hypothetical protein